MTAPEEMPSGHLNLVPCKVCGRGFTKDRIQTHVDICKKQKTRKVYNIAEKRIEGTDAEELMKSGHLKLDFPRPNVKKSVLDAKLKGTKEATAPLPPIPSQKGRRKSTAKKMTESYQVVFDANDKMKTKKSTKFPTAVPPPLTAKRMPTASKREREIDHRQDIDKRQNKQNTFSVIFT